MRRPSSRSPLSRTNDSPRPSRFAGFVSRLRSLPLGFLLAALIVLLAGAFPLSPILDAATRAQIPEARLVKPLGYLATAPFSNLFDTLTLLSVRQHIALVSTLILCYLIWWVSIGRASLRHITPGRRALREIARIGVGLVVLVGTYALAILLPRPMARLEKAIDIVTIDFHAHTKYSHDGRPGWGAEDVRKWHSNSGFDVAYITDHRTFQGAREGWANNPTLAGGGTVLIPGIEVVWRGEHINVLDADRLYNGLFNETLRDIDEEALALASTLPNNEPVLIETIPGKLSQMVPAAGPGTGGVRAIEIIDGAPRGLGQLRREHDAVIQLADSFNLALVAGSDHHGWGYTAAGWTLMYLPGWRAATAEQLSVQISRVIRAGGRGSTRVAARHVADTESGLALPLTVPLVTWGMLRTMNGEERISVLVWLALFYLLLRLRASWRTPHTPAVGA